MHYETDLAIAALAQAYAAVKQTEIACDNHVWTEDPDGHRSAWEVMFCDRLSAALALRIEELANPKWHTQLGSGWRE